MKFQQFQLSNLFPKIAIEKFQTGIAFIFLNNFYFPQITGFWGFGEIGRAHV
jgi:hypothetical protein